MFNATEAILDVLSEAISRMVFPQEDVFEHRVPITIREKKGRWGHTVKRDRLYIVYDSPNLAFKPEVPLHIHIPSIARAIRTDAKREAVTGVNRIYLTSREVASDSVFSHVKQMLDYLESSGISNNSGREGE